VNRDEAKKILQLHRPGTMDGDDPLVAEALVLAKQDAELSRWLAEERARQEALRAKFRQITPPAGLKEQIISEHAAAVRRKSRRHSFALAATCVLLLACAGLFWWWQLTPPANDLAIYRSRMVRVALTGYAMDLTTNSLPPVRTYLAQRQAPADYELPEGLQKAAITGCAVEKWQGANVSLVCFRTGKPLPPGASSDLWLFVVDRRSLPQAPPPGAPELANVNRLITATWTVGDRVYLLCAAGDEATLRAYF
jgi:hypothetical protein